MWGLFVWVFVVSLEAVAGPGEEANLGEGVVGGGGGLRGGARRGEGEADVDVVVGAEAAAVFLADLDEFVPI